MFLRFLTAGPSEAATARGWRGPALRSMTETGLSEVPESHFYIIKIFLSDNCIRYITLSNTLSDKEGGGVNKTTPT